MFVIKSDFVTFIIEFKVDTSVGEEVNSQEVEVLALHESVF